MNKKTHQSQLYLENILLFSGQNIPASVINHDQILIKIGGEEHLHTTQ
jgi:hypothetical protein